MTTDNDGYLKIRPPITAEEHQQQKFEEFKISEEEGLDKGYDKMQKILTQMNTLKIKPDPEEINMKFLRGLPSSWSGIALILKTKGGLEYISFDDLYNKLKFLEIDTKGYSSSSSTLSNVAFVSTAGISQGNLLYQESGNGGYGGYTTTLSASPGFSSSMGSSKSKCSVFDDVIYSFFANHEIDQQLVYEDLDQMNKDEFKEYDLRHQMAMLSIKVHRFEKKHGWKIKFNGRENARFDKKLVICFNYKQMGHFSRECRAQGVQNSNNYQKYKSKKAGKDGSDSKAMVVVDGEVVSADDVILADVSVSAGPVAAAAVSLHSETEFALMGLSTEGQPIYNRFALVDHMKAVPPPLTRNYMPPSNIPNIDESQMVYGKKATGSSEIKTNDDSIYHSHDSVLFEFSDSVSAPASEFSDTIVIDCARQEDFPNVCTSSIETNVKFSKPLCNTFGSFNKGSHFRKHKSCYVCGSYLHVIKDCDLHEQRLVKRHAKGKGILGRRPTGKPVNPNTPKPVFAGQPNPVFAGQSNPISAGQPNPISFGPPNPVNAGQPNPVSAGNGILGPRPLNI
uniref:CCHC-type domain-containing protein n=1 Tax=Tanacetum cinerariifolium TaxID=118510 RepID=A0A6L2K122_TANCI|nr:hypothetical protein [Tanacetum cinerariifolium]